MASTELDLLYSEIYSLDLEKLISKPENLALAEVNQVFSKAQREIHDSFLYERAGLSAPQSPTFKVDFDSDGSHHTVSLLCPPFLPELLEATLKEVQTRLKIEVQIPENCAKLTSRELLGVLEKKGCLKQSETPRITPNL